MKMFEVEQKFRLDSPGAIVDRLTALGLRVGPAVIQTDRYFSHPSRDFAKSDEALRIRSVGEKNYVTYKGPKIDAATKTRQEVELPIEGTPQGATRFSELLVLLGFTLVGAVRKERRTASTSKGDQHIEIAIDHVDGLGWFAEIELIAKLGDLDAAQATVLDLAKTLGLTEIERRSYLEMLLFAG